MGIQVSIDGPAGAGKSTAARLLAKRLGFNYVNTGAMYRALTLLALQYIVDWEDEDSLVMLFERHNIDQRGTKTFIDNKDVSLEIRSNKVSRAVSIICRHRGVRERMVKLQRRIAEKGSIVMDGRDIGTVVLPNADVKIFLTASVEKRAKRRLEDLRELGKPLPYDDVLENILRRDKIDSTRKIAPLIMADDAILVDNTDIPIDEEINFLEKLVREKIKDKLNSQSN